MAIYYITILTLTGLGYVLTEKKKERATKAFYLAGVFILFTMLASFRYAIGFDYFSYEAMYEMVSAYSFADILHYYWQEPLFFIVGKLFSIAGCPYTLYLAGLNVFLFFSIVWFIYHYSKMPWMSVYLFITLQFLAYNMNLLRQSIAAAFFLFAYPYLKNRRIVPFSIFMLIGSLFHNSLLFMYPLYFLLPKKHTRRLLVFIITVAMCGYVLFEPLFQLAWPFIPEKYAQYPETYFWNANGFEYILFPAAYAVLVFVFRKRIADTRERAIYQNSALYNFLISLFITKHFILERFAVYPFLCSLLAIPDIIASYQATQHSESKTQKGTYYYVMALFLAFGAAYFIFASTKGFHNVYPYISLLDKSRSAPN